MVKLFESNLYTTYTYFLLDNIFGCLYSLWLYFMFYLGFFMYYFLFIKKERSAFSFVFLFFLLFFTMTLCFAADRDDFSEDGSGPLKFNKSARGKDAMSVVTSVKGKTMAIFSNRDETTYRRA